MRHVVHLSAASIYGGGEEHVRTLLKALQSQKKEGEKVSLICPEGASLADKVRELSIDVHHLNFKGKRDFLAPLRLRKMIRKIRGTIVHSHNRREDLASIVGLTAFPCFRLTTIHDRVNMNQSGMRSHTVFDGVYLNILKRFDMILAVSQETLDDYCQLSGDERAHLSVITNGMDLDRVKNIKCDKDFREKNNISQSSFVVMMSARVRNCQFGKKGHLRMLDILSQVKGDVHFVTLGEDEVSAQELKRQAEKHYVKFTSLGFVPNPIYVLAHSDVVVLPSLFEGLPRSLMEAMALGKPVVGSDVDGVRTLLDGGECGCLVAHDDLSGWTQVLQNLLTDTDLRKNLAQKAKRHIEHHYDANKMAAEHWKIYRER